MLDVYSDRGTASRGDTTSTPLLSPVPLRRREKASWSIDSDWDAHLFERQPAVTRMHVCSAGPSLRNGKPLEGGKLLSRMSSDDVSPWGFRGYLHEALHGDWAAGAEGWDGKKK